MHYKLSECVEQFQARVRQISSIIKFLSATSMAANYRAVGLARSKAEFISKLGIVIEEADETVFWLELLGDSGIVETLKLRELLAEGNQLVAIFLASRRTAKS